MMGMKKIRVQSRNATTRLRLFGLRLAVGAFAFHVSAVAALAQRPGQIPDEDGGMLQWAVVGGVGVVICLTGFLNSKRSHLN